MNALKHELSLFAAATAFAVVCALVWGSPFVGNSPAAGGVFAKSIAQAPPQSQVFRGTVIRQGARLVLRDSSGQIFRLDHSAQAQSYLGKDVTVTGEIDAATKTIRRAHIAAHGA